MKSQYDVDRKHYKDLKDSVAVPNYQRKLVWSEKQKEDFILNISKGFPFGSILLYQYENESKMSLIDGLQRFSTLSEYSKNPSKYFTEYGPFVDDVLAMIQEGFNSSGTTLSEGQAKQFRETLESIMRSFLKEENPAPYYLRNEIFAKINVVPNTEENRDKLLTLQQNLKNAADTFLDLDDLLIPCIIFTGAEEQLPDVFANLNQGGTKLSKYQVFAAQWTKYEFALESDQNGIGDRILEKVIDRYDWLEQNRELEIIDYNSDDMRAGRKINLSEYCFALGELILEEAPVFWGNIASSDSDGRDDVVNVVGYLSAAIALGVDNRSVSMLAGKRELFKKPGFAVSLTEKILSEYQVINNRFKTWLTVPGYAVPPKYESGAVTNMQVLSFFAALWHCRYDIDESVPTINVREHYKENGYSATCENMVAYCVSDVVSRVWMGSGDSRLASYYVESKDSSLNSYRVKPTRDELYVKLHTWLDEVTKKGSLNVEKISRFLLCVYSAPKATEFGADKYDVEHVISRQKLNENKAYSKDDIPGGSLGNIMYLKEKTNRGKGGMNLYSVEEHEGVEITYRYINLNDYPDRLEIDGAEFSLANGDSQPAINLIVNRGKVMIDKIAKSLSS